MLGPRQVGKPWLIQKELEGREHVISIRQDCERDPALLLRQVRALPDPVIVFIDEDQKVPTLFDTAQYLIDERKASFIFSGSSARKRILQTPRYFFFDLGVRNALARLPLTPDLERAQKGILFEHAVVLELIRRCRALRKDYSDVAPHGYVVTMGDQPEALAENVTALPWRMI
jgi:predicted AAA+ superfamily ATPase